MRRHALVFAGASLVAACSPAGKAIPWPAPANGDAGAPGADAAAAPVVVDDSLLVPIYEGALAPGWNDWGWSPKVLGNGPAKLDLSNNGGWILQHETIDARFGALVFELKAPKDAGDFLEVHLLGPSQGFPEIVIDASLRKDSADGFTEVRVPFARLNPEGLPFDRVFMHAVTSISPGTVLVDHLGFTRPTAEDLAPRPPKAARPVALTVDCKAKGHAIDPQIYGIAYDTSNDPKDTQQYTMGATARRWGGNATSRYNWELGNAWSSEKDWYFENVDYSGVPGFTYASFLEANLLHHMATALTVPMLGWVAKDTKSYSFSVKELGPQQSVDPYKPDAGNGKKPDGTDLAPPPPSKTSVASTPDSIKRWVQAIRAADKKRGSRSVQAYILDNEPNLWSTTHRDVHPQPLGYDELLERTIAYAAAIRAADPDAVIAGPAEWGWTNYFYSAKDAAAGFDKKPDRKAHGDVPLVAWYLKKVREHEQKTKTRVLDVLDLHFYPQGNGIYGASADPDTAARRLRATRALWDPTYVDESWINDTIQLLPRMQRWIDDNAPGLGISIGEWSFGGERHMSGGLAVAEVLGRFGQAGVRSAFYWTYPAAKSPAFWAFRAYRDFDGQGGHFLEQSLPSTAGEGASIFASRDAAGKHLVIIVLNFEPDRELAPQLTLEGCGKVASERAFRYVGGEAGILLAQPLTSVGKPSNLPPYSITIHDVELAATP